MAAAPGARGYRREVPVRTGERADAAFIVEMARLASVIEDDPLPPADDPRLMRMLSSALDTAVLSLDDGGQPIAVPKRCPMR